MKLIKTIVNMAEKDAAISALSKEISLDNITVRNIVSSIKRPTKEYSYRGKTIQQTSIQNIEQAEISCWLESTNDIDAVERILRELRGNTHVIDLGLSQTIDSISDNNNRDIKIAFVVPVENDLITPIYTEVLYSGYSIEKLGSIPSTMSEVMPYDMIVIDVSRQRFSPEELSRPLYLPIDIPIVIVNRSDTPIDKIAFMKIGFRSIHDIKNPDIILSSIYSVISEYTQGHKKKILPKSADMSESKFAIVFSCFT